MVVYWHRTSLIPTVAAGLLLISRAAVLVFSADEPQNDALRGATSGRGDAPMEQALSEVDGILLRSTPFPHCVEALGRVKAARDVKINARVGGMMREGRVRNGDDVAEGEILAKLDDTECRLDYERAASLLLGALRWSESNRV